MGLKRADTTATRRFEREDGAWLEIRVSLTGREDAIINDCTASERILREDGRVALQPPKQEFSDPRVFGLMVKGWSLEDGEPDAKAYDDLDAQDRKWVNSCINEAVQQARGESEGNAKQPGTAAPQSDSQSSSAPQEPESPPST